jgi:hypothetical protein
MLLDINEDHLLKSNRIIVDSISFLSIIDVWI